MILGILVLCDTMINIITNVGHLDLYFHGPVILPDYLECYLMYELHYVPPTKVVGGGGGGGDIFFGMDPIGVGVKLPVRSVT